MSSFKSSAITLFHPSEKADILTLFFVKQIHNGTSEHLPIRLKIFHPLNSKGGLRWI